MARHCRVCREITLHRDRGGSICKTCMPGRAKKKPRPVPPHRPARPGVYDLSKYVPGTIAPPALLDRVLAEARSAIGGYSRQNADLYTSSSRAWKVHHEFHRRLRELGVPVEGA